MPSHTMFKNCFQSARSFNWEGIHVMDQWSFAAYCASRSLPRKWRAMGMMKPARLSLRSSYSISMSVTHFFDMSSLIICTQALCFLKGSASLSCLVLMIHPNIFNHSARVTSAMNFDKESRSSLQMVLHSSTGWLSRWMTSGTILDPLSMSHSKKVVKIALM
jgi:hypothetical protein